MTKRLIVILLVFALCMSLTACGGMLGSLMNIGGKGSSSDDDLTDILGDMDDIWDDLEDMPTIKAPEIDLPEIVIPEIDVPAIEAPAATAPAAESNELEDIICGTWLRETMYLEHYGCDADMYTSFHSNGRADQVLLRHDNGELLNEASGDWWFEGDDVVMQKDGTTSHIRFIYEKATQRIRNGDKYYIKID